MSKKWFFVVRGSNKRKLEKFKKYVENESWYWGVNAKIEDVGRWEDE